MVASLHLLIIVLLALATPTLSAVSTATKECQTGTPSATQLSTSQACSITSITVSPDASIGLTGVQTFCACGPTQYDVSTVTRGKTAYLGCVFHGPHVQSMSMMSLATDIPSETISMTKILCATKAPSAGEKASWGSVFKVEDARSAVDRVCDFDKPISLVTSDNQFALFLRDVPNITKDEGKNAGKNVNLFLTAISRGNCDVTFDRGLCREAYHEILSGHPSCPNRDGWTMGGVGISQCAEFRLTGGITSDKSRILSDIQAAQDWDTSHYCDAKLNAKCEL